MDILKNPKALIHEIILKLEKKHKEEIGAIKKVIEEQQNRIEALEEKVEEKEEPLMMTTSSSTAMYHTYNIIVDDSNGSSSSHFTIEPASDVFHDCRICKKQLGSAKTLKVSHIPNHSHYISSFSLVAKRNKNCCDSFLQNHMRIVHGDEKGKKLACGFGECQKNFRTTDELNRHRRIHTGIRSIGNDILGHISINTSFGFVCRRETLPMWRLWSIIHAKRESLRTQTKNKSMRGIGGAEKFIRSI